MHEDHPNPPLANDQRAQLETLYDEMRPGTSTPCGKC